MNSLLDKIKRKIKVKNIKVPSAAILLGALRVKV